MSCLCKGANREPVGVTFCSKAPSTRPLFPAEKGEGVSRESAAFVAEGNTGTSGRTPYESMRGPSTTTDTVMTKP